MFGKRIYVVAVSGGVDSVVLLHKLTQRKSDKIEYVVAHLNHGMRDEAGDDAEFVRKLAEQYNCQFELGEAILGSHASEATARTARYAFLRNVQTMYKADAIVTAHHQDDLLETMIINMLRGTGPRGLMPMQYRKDVLRPLIHRKKVDLLDYAKEHGLEWREDSTNSDTRYLRNHVRHNILPKYLDRQKADLLVLREQLIHDYIEIDLGIRAIAPTNTVLPRMSFAPLPWRVKCEVMRAWLLHSGVDEVDRTMIEQAVVMAVVLRPGKKTDIGSQHWMSAESGQCRLSKKTR